MTVTQEQYQKEKTEFFISHNNDYEITTYPLENSGYLKKYVFTDNAQWYENLNCEICSTKIEINRCNINIDVKMAKTEFWSTESASKTYYEKW